MPTTPSPTSVQTDVWHQLDYVPAEVEDLWTPAWSDDERAEALGMLSAAVAHAFNPADDDVAQIAILTEAVLRAARFIAEQPCDCNDDDGQCPRCAALGRVSDRQESTS